MYIEQKKYEKAQAATQLQAAIRGHLARQEFKRINEALKKKRIKSLRNSENKACSCEPLEGEKAQAKRE